jgi:hypothetical protein
VIFFGLGLMHGRLDRISCPRFMKGTAWSTYAPCPAGSSKRRVSSGSCHSAVATARSSAGAPFAPMGRPRPWLSSMALQVGLNGRCRTSSPPRRRPDHLADASSYRIRPIRRGIGVALHRLDEPAPAALTTRIGPKLLSKLNLAVDIDFFGSGSFEHPSMAAMIRRRLLRRRSLRRRDALQLPPPRPRLPHAGFAQPPFGCLSRQSPSRPCMPR